ncbi:hypothetical protein BDQ17DRAFT_1399955 [Cyathus striatus]|nr:hypothetical protein BDQ17DRAFT_1399955 [Cyathus striatus]
MSTDDDDFNLDAVFPEPPRPPTPEPTTSVYQRNLDRVQSDEDWKQIDVRLVGTHTLWGQYLWNAARAIASYLDSHPELYEGRAVLELGAAGALPSLVTAKNGAEHASFSNNVVITDYPDADLVNNINFNIERNIPSSRRAAISVLGYIWGRPVQPLLNALPLSRRFNLIILSDLIFNHSQHDALLTTCEQTLAPNDAVVLVFYTHHRPHLAHKDMDFFEKSRQRGWKCEEFLTEKFPPMFPEDSGEESVRATVHGWRLTR